jgi:hypothetical protein
MLSETSQTQSYKYYVLSNSWKPVSQLCRRWQGIVGTGDWEEQGTGDRKKTI